MSIKEQVGEENWKYLFNAMSAASSFVSIASGGGTESIKELFCKPPITIIPTFSKLLYFNILYK